jgi:cytochrome c oxidase cbb3-type subunit 3
MTTDNTNNKNEDYEFDTLTNDRLIKDHDYDGIRELDNDLPPWWKWLFYLTIAFSVIYLVRLFVFNADDLKQDREYIVEMEGFEKTRPNNTSEANFEIVLLEDNASLVNGEAIWNKVCLACHLKDGGGLVGPNMTDNFWIHGNTVDDLYRISTDGVIAKGMLPYKDQLSNQERLEVVSFILVKLQGTTPASPKASEGTEY